MAANDNILSDQQQTLNEVGMSDIPTQKAGKKISAFEVHEKGKKKKKGAAKGVQGIVETRQDGKPDNPIKMFQDMAKKFGVKNLPKRLVL